MRKATRLGLLLGALALLGLTSNQVLNRANVYLNIGSLFSWGPLGAQPAWNGSAQVLTCADFSTYIRNDGTICANNQAAVIDSYAVAHAVNTNSHSPIISNYNFSTGTLTPWASANTGSCTGTLFSATAAGGVTYAQATSATCTSTTATVNLTQSFTTGGTPTSQTWSYQYNALQATSGDPVNCSAGVGALASLVLKINGTTINTLASPTLDGNWHTVNGTTTALVSGSNTIEIDATGLAAASGSYVQRYVGGNPVCGAVRQTTQPVQLTAVTLTANW